MDMKFIKVPDLPEPAGHYSPAVSANGFVFVAGQLPRDAHGVVPAGVDAQVRQAFANVDAVLRAAGSSLERIVSVTVYVTDIDNWPAVNAAYAAVLGDHKPARTIAVSPQLHFGCLLELQVVALA
jgi:2-iminobutanoate/2-iminopropanoate deaminase